MWLVRLFPLLAIGQLLEAAQSSPTAASRKMDSNENLMLIYAFEGEPKSSEPNESKPIRRSIPPQAFAMGGMGGMNGIGGMGGMGGISGMGGMGGIGGMGGFGGLGGMGGIGGLSGAGGIGGIGGLSGVGGMGGIGGMTGGMGAFPGAFGGPSGYGGYGGMGYLGPSAMYGTGFRGYPGYNSMANTAGMTYPYWNTQLGTTWANPGFNNFVNSWNTLNSNPSMYNSGTWGLTNVIPSSSGFGNDLYNSGSWNRVNYNSGDPYNQYPGQNGIFGGQSGFSNGQSFYNRYNGQSAFGTSQTYGSGTSTSFSTDNNYKRSSPGPQSPYYVRLFPDPFNQDNEETSSSSLSKSRTTGRRSATVGDQPAPQAEPL